MTTEKETNGVTLSDSCISNALTSVDHSMRLEKDVERPQVLQGHACQGVGNPSLTLSDITHRRIAQIYILITWRTQTVIRIEMLTKNKARLYRLVSTCIVCMNFNHKTAKDQSRMLKGEVTTLHTQYELILLRLIQNQCNKAGFALIIYSSAGLWRLQHYWLAWWAAITEGEML